MYRHEDEATGGSFLLGMLAGIVIGAGVGMLFAPRSGSETRKRLSESASRMKEQAADGYDRVSGRVSDLVDRGRDSIDRVRESVTRGVEDVRRHGQEAVDAASRLASQAVGTINEMTSRRS